MKKILSILTVLCICGISAFAQNTAPKENIMKDKKVLVAFFSRTGENYNVGNISKGNTHIIAEMIAGETNGKLFQIEPVKPYPDEYRACVDIAKTEKENKARPAVKEDIAAEDYDVIFLGYPNWWGDLPMAVYSFLDEVDLTGKTIVPFVTSGGSGLSGKTVIPFCTHEGSELSGTERLLEQACKGATIAKGLAVQGTTAQNSQAQAKKTVQSWLNKLK